MTKQLKTVDTQNGELVEMPKQQDSIMAVIARVASDPDADITKLERMLEMKERLDDRAREDENRAAQKEFFAALTAAQSEVPVVVKNRQNDFNKSTFADLAAIENVAMPVIRSHGFNVTAKSIPGAENGMQRILFRVAHTCGHVDEFEDDYALDSAGSGGKASKTPIQAKGSTVTYARRYMLCAYFNIAIGDRDGQPQKPAEKSELTASQSKEIYGLIEETSTDEKLFLKAAKAASVEAIAPARFDALRARLIQKRNDQAAASEKAASAEKETTVEKEEA
tara:strand:+ start:12747 stop:13586 length:840 start_codon:yes stop_codon:yes gene_type:complete